MLNVNIDKDKNNFEFCVKGNILEIVADVGVLLFKLREMIRDQSGECMEEVLKLMLMNVLDAAFSEEADELIKKADKINDNEEAFDTIKKWLEE